jgi:hypothetical protein
MVDNDGDSEEARSLRPLQAAACICRIAFGHRAEVVLRLKTPWRDGTTHWVISPLEFMQWLAALVPRPRLRLIRFQGVLAPNARASRPGRAARDRAADASHSTRRVRGDLHAPPADAAELGPAAQAGLSCDTTWVQVGLH